MNEDFLSTVSHELRTPLTSIRGFSQTMLASWDKLDDESKKRFLNVIVEQSNRLINLVENMLSVTKLQNTKAPLILKEVSIKSVVDTVCSLLKTQYKDKVYNIEINADKVLADKDKFQQIVMNLIENASKYGDYGSNIYINSGLNGDFVSFNVTNTGEEINSADYDKIFEKFSRIDNPLTRKVQGSGLGLYITKNLVEKMGGKISVNSQNRQTTFEVLMPSVNIERQAQSAVSNIDN